MFASAGEDTKGSCLRLLFRASRDGFGVDTEKLTGPHKPAEHDRGCDTSTHIHTPLSIQSVFLASTPSSIRFHTSSMRASGGGAVHPPHTCMRANTHAGIYSPALPYIGSLMSTCCHQRVCLRACVHLLGCAFSHMHALRSFPCVGNDTSALARR
jgi:hypothetical protein